MKKILLFFAAAVCAIASWADDVVTAKYSGNKLDVELTNTTTFLAFQMDIDLPEGVNVTSIESNIERLAQGANVQINGEDTPTPFVIARNVIDVENNVLRVVAYNLGNHEIKEAEGKLFTINFDNAVTEASISNILFVDNALVEQKIQNAIATKGGVFADVDGDTYVTTADCALVLKMVTGESAKTAEGDVDGDTAITTADAAIVLKVVTGEYAK